MHIRKKTKVKLLFIIIFSFIFIYNISMLPINIKPVFFSEIESKTVWCTSNFRKHPVYQNLYCVSYNDYNGDTGLIKITKKSFIIKFNNTELIELKSNGYDLRNLKIGDTLTLYRDKYLGKICYSHSGLNIDSVTDSNCWHLNYKDVKSSALTLFIFHLCISIISIILIICILCKKNAMRY